MSLRSKRVPFWSWACSWASPVDASRRMCWVSRHCATFWGCATTLQFERRSLRMSWLGFCFAPRWAAWLPTASKGACRARRFFHMGKLNCRSWVAYIRLFRNSGHASLHARTCASNFWRSSQYATGRAWPMHDPRPERRQVTFARRHTYRFANAPSKCMVCGIQCVLHVVDDSRVLQWVARPLILSAHILQDVRFHLDVAACEHAATFVDLGGRSNTSTKQCLVTFLMLACILPLLAAEADGIPLFSGDGRTAQGSVPWQSLKFFLGLTGLTPFLNVCARRGLAWRLL